MEVIHFVEKARFGLDGGMVICGVLFLGEKGVLQADLLVEAGNVL